VAAGDGTPAVGSAVTISVRPEHVKLGPAAGDAANRWEGRIQDVTFMGSIVRARVMIPGGVALTAEVQNDVAPRLSPGAAVMTGWSPRHTVVLAR
jgi:ABC-type Fe3+/spermidine/putrescine transport system ATPase subunit